MLEIKEETLKAIDMLDITRKKRIELCKKDIKNSYFNANRTFTIQDVEKDTFDVVFDCDTIFYVTLERLLELAQYYNVSLFISYEDGKQIAHFH